ncbi:MAG: hypothetical protein ACI83I_002227 [Bacteroidia bacterium]|jgi:hypothetical protein
MKCKLSLFQWIFENKQDDFRVLKTGWNVLCFSSIVIRFMKFTTFYVIWSNQKFEKCIGQNGFMVHFVDSEGNKFTLHSKSKVLRIINFQT